MTRRSSPQRPKRRTGVPGAAQLSFSALLTRSPFWPAMQLLEAPNERTRAWVPEDVAEFERRAIAAGKSGATAVSHGYLIRGMLKWAMRKEGCEIGVSKLFADVALLADAACDDMRLIGPDGGKIGLATLAARRGAIRAYARLMEDATGITAEHLIERFEAELRQRCRLDGQTYQLLNGTSLHRKRYVPTRRDVEGLLSFTARRGWAFYRSRFKAMVHLLVGTGVRISSAIAIRGEDFRRTGGRLHVFIREKGKPEEQEKFVPPIVEQALGRYVEDYNRFAVERGSSIRIGIGVSGPFWLSANGLPWTRRTAQAVIRYASASACKAPFGPHALRHFRARKLVDDGWTREVISEAVGWNGTLMLDRHYGPKPGEGLKLRVGKSKGSMPNDKEDLDERGEGTAA
jgi:integrase